MIDWKKRHYQAMNAPLPSEQPIVLMVDGWIKYAQTHKQRFESSIGDDGVLGPAWEAVGDALRTFLNGELGRLDAGTLDGLILDTMRDNGVDVEHK